MSQTQFESRLLSINVLMLAVKTGLDQLPDQPAKPEPAYTEDEVLQSELKQYRVDIHPEGKFKKTLYVWATSALAAFKTKRVMQIRKSISSAKIEVVEVA